MANLFLALILSLAPPLTPTYASCFEAYWSRLENIAIDQGYGRISDHEAYMRRLRAAADYEACRKEAFRAWLRERIRIDPTRYD